MPKVLMSLFILVSNVRHNFSAGKEPLIEEFKVAESLLRVELKHF